MSEPIEFMAWPDFYLEGSHMEEMWKPFLPDVAGSRCIATRIAAAREEMNTVVLNRPAHGAIRPSGLRAEILGK